MSCISGIGIIMAIGLPPVEYDCKPKLPITVMEFKLADVNAMCGKLPNQRPMTYACTRVLPDRCLIVLPKVERGGVTKQQQDRLRRHEEGHCNGWSARHEEIRQ
jgi:hypothetical protein